ncbi:hypothetical protein AWV79_09260 [Cupriavidus sp. UYMMa02A]|nr:hypothetical protein AWV79_09260 [Cupriavidus sp. UYMMa02A]
MLLEGLQLLRVHAGLLWREGGRDASWRAPSGGVDWWFACVRWFAPLSRLREREQFIGMRGIAVVV